MADERDEHRAFLNRYYGISRHFYDLTRRYYLIGREVALRELLEEDWDSLLEVGVGTGRNLRILHERRPRAVLGGIDASDEMLTHVRTRAPWAKVEFGFAEDADLTQVLGQRPERILFSYCISMVKDPIAALRNAQRALAPKGKVLIVDFGDLQGMPRLAEGALRRFLDAFHVKPVPATLFRDVGARTRYGLGHYYVLGTLGPLDED